MVIIYLEQLNIKNDKYVVILYPFQRMDRL